MAKTVAEVRGRNVKIHSVQKSAASGVVVDRFTLLLSAVQIILVELSPYFFVASACGDFEES